MNKPSEFPKIEKIKEYKSMLPLIISIVLVIGLLIYGAISMIKEEEELPELKGEPISEIPDEEEIIIKEVVIEEKAQPKLTDREIIARVVAAEARGERFVGKVAVAAVVINRAREFGMTIEEVVTSPNQFAWPYDGEVSVSCYEAVDYALENRDLFPRNMLYFKAADFHTFRGAVDYMQIGKHYFSTKGDPEWDMETLGIKD